MRLGISIKFNLIVIAKCLNSNFFWIYFYGRIYTVWLSSSLDGKPRHNAFGRVVENVLEKRHTRCYTAAYLWQ